MSQLYVPGPAQIFVSTAGADNAQTYQFLGLTESECRPEFNAFHADENADYAGMVPADVAFMGEEAVVQVTLKRFNWAVYEKCCCRLRGATRGTIPACGLGTLMLTELKTFGLIIKAPYAVCKSAFYSGMSAGLRFPTVYVAGPYAQPVSMRSTKPSLTFRCLPVVDPVAGTSFLYDSDMTPVASVSVN